MDIKQISLSLGVALLAVAVWVPNAAAFDITGGPTWAARTGPGVSFSLGIQGCTQDFCQDDLETAASIGGTVGFFYRIIPNAVVFAEFHVGHIPSEIGDFREFHEFQYPGGPMLWGDVDNDDVMSLQATAGAEFHLPVAAWAAPYLGFGVGYSYLGVWGEIDRRIDDRSFHASLHGVDFQLRFGADFYPFVKLQNLGIGPALLVNLPAWITGCWDIEDGDDHCDDVDDFIDDRDERPFVIYFGILGRYGF